MYGIRFEINNAYDNFLEKILNKINILEYNWQILHDDVFDENNQYKFNKEYYKGNEFSELIKGNKYYIISLKLAAYKKTCYKEINNYEGFEKSEARLFIKIIDNIFVDVYAKEKSLLDIIINNLKSNMISNIEYISQSNLQKYFDND